MFAGHGIHTTQDEKEIRRRDRDTNGRLTNFFYQNILENSISHQRSTNLYQNIEKNNAFYQFQPAAIEDLRKWTSTEAIGDITVPPNGLSNVGPSSVHNSSALNDNSYASFSTSYVDGIDVTASNDVIDATNDIPLDHKLPSPEEQIHTIAKKFPAEIVPVNTSGIRFDRMCSMRRSLGHVPMGSSRPKNDELQAIRRSARPRKAVGKRRNTIAGIEDKDIKEAYTHRNSMQIPKSTDTSTAQNMPRSRSNDLIRTSVETNAKIPMRFNHFKALKQWGRHRLKLINRNSDGRIEEIDEEFSYTASVPETKPIKSKQKTPSEKMLKQDPLYSSSEKIFTSLIQADKKFAVPSTTSVKMRASLSRRQKRNQQRVDEPNSSSGNWSASSESGRTSASSEITMHTKSSTSSLNHNKHPSSVNVLTQRKFLNVSTSSSITSDDTLNHEVPIVLSDLYDDETSSMYSCDTEGYFTSFHVDSGLKTLKEEDIPAPVPAMLSTSAFTPSEKTMLSVDSDYELFGKGSTSTTASSAGTVCTALLGSLSNGSLADVPNVPERKSSLNSKFHTISNYGKPKCVPMNRNLLNRSESLKTSIENEKTGPYQLAAKKPPVANEIDHSENSDFEGVERVKRIRGKTLINSNRIPSICVITPLNSDDEDRVAVMGNILTSLNLNATPDSVGKGETVQVHKDSIKDKAEVKENVSTLVSELKRDLSLMNVAPFNQTAKDDRSYDESDGDYVTIKGSSANQCDAIESDLDAVLTGSLDLTTEYISLNELPVAANYHGIFSDKSNMKHSSRDSGDRNVVRNDNGKFVYDSNSLRYNRGLCTTFKNPTFESKPAKAGFLERNLDLAGADGDYVTLSQTARLKLPFSELGKVLPPFDLRFRRLIVFLYFSDKDEMIRLQKSATWPPNSVGSSPVKESNKFRRFSWEFLSKRRKPKLTAQKVHHKKFLEMLNIKAKPKTPFRTSTPLKQEADKSSANFSSYNQSLTPVRSTKPDDVRNTKCSDRLGVPKTTLTDFKKLLLTTTGKRNVTTKPSAVEQLKLKRDSVQEASAIKILDLTHSPRAFTNRRLLNQGNPPAVYKKPKPNIMSPRSRWKMNNFNKNTISSIPEVNCEEDATCSQVRSEIVDSKAMLPSNLAKPTGQSKTNIIETTISMRDNIFLQTEENNFMRGEIKPYGSATTQKSIESKFLAKTNDKSHESQTLDSSERSEAKCLVSHALETSF